ncbi:hypothetical protein [Pseudomonas frederiksbergensis]|uniref:Uncharacterized protein n=1 Tax=Pseudomonas frederiksbergensis TaxID=104087 RepID=A0A423HQB6_9PSED|nr:hypothetical protein [Pseudomonas frederiksbergensis]RON15386.1 hypothetical protein BK662_14880 [Pseudomonas frederiksbergensis]
MREVLVTYIDAYEVSINCLEQFHGTELATAVDGLLSRIAACDDVLVNNILKHHCHVLELSGEEWVWFLPSILELERNSAFVAAYLIEQIPLIKRHLDMQVFVRFLLAIKDQSARGLSYLIGTSDSALCDDLESILEVVGVAYYRAVMDCVLLHKDELGPCCAPLLIHIKNYNRHLPVTDLDALVALVCDVHARYGSFGAVALLENADVVFSRHSIQSVHERLGDLLDESVDYFHYLLANGLPKVGGIRTVTASVEQLDGASLISHIDAPGVFDGGLVSAIISNMSFMDPKTLENMRYQLAINDFNRWFEHQHAFINARMRIADSYTAFWFSPFDYWGGEIGIARFRTLLGQAIEATYDKVARQTLVYGNKSLFDRNAEYTEARLRMMIDAAFPKDSSEILVPEDIASIRIYLDDQDRESFRDRQSRQRVFISTWNRNPWQDYSRSDEFYSCTGIGDYAVNNAPGYLVEPNLCRLYVWYQGRRIGRINLIAVADVEGAPGLLLDGVEGGGRLLQSEERMLDILGCVAEFAKRCGLSTYYINCKATYNNVPKQFIAQAICHVGLPVTNSYLRRFYQGMEIYQAMPHGLIPFFESFGNNLSGVVRCLKITLP